MFDVSKIIFDMQRNTQELQEQAQQYREKVIQADRALSGVKRCYRDYINAVEDLKALHNDLIREYETWQSTPTAKDIQAIFNTFEPTPTQQ